jgi:hypothetical protein
MEVSGSTAFTLTGGNDVARSVSRFEELLSSAVSNFEGCAFTADRLLE